MTTRNFLNRLLTLRDISGLIFDSCRADSAHYNGDSLTFLYVLQIALSIPGKQPQWIRSHDLAGSVGVDRRPVLEAD